MNDLPLRGSRSICYGEEREKDLSTLELVPIIRENSLSAKRAKKIGLKLLCGDVDLFPEVGCNNLITGSLGVVGGLGNGDEVFC